MKRVLSIILALIMLCLGASAEGLLPMIGNVYGEDMPSMRRILLRDPDTTESIENNGIKLTFNKVTEEEFNSFSVYLQEFGCELAGYSLENTQMNATVQKNGHTFTLSYDYSNGNVVLTYPSDTKEEKVDIAAVAAAMAAAFEAAWQPGKYVSYGHYPQTKAGNDNTPIEWLVLARDGNKALLISRYALDCQQYHSSEVDITWQKCSLRTWLNGTFLNKAFTSSEQKGIVTTNVDNSKSQGYSGYSTNGGNNTQDKVFLLSYAEAWKYFKDDSARMSAPTEYAVKQGAWTSSSNNVGGKATCYWWLRSPGNSQNRAIFVYTDGSHNSNYVLYSFSAVRPALWVNLESGIF